MNSSKSQIYSIARRKPNLAFYHPNPRSTGCALKMALCPAQSDAEGCILVKMARQCPPDAVSAEVKVISRFDWENAICVKLDFNDLCKFLQVLRGECESIEGERGLYHRFKGVATRIVLRHMLEPFPGYSFELYRTAPGAEDSSCMHFVLSSAEALGVCEAIAGSMSLISFGVPMVDCEGEEGDNLGKSRRCYENEDRN